MPSIPDKLPNTLSQTIQHPTNESVISSITAVNEATYNGMQLIDQEPGWNEEVQQVAVVLSASRSGSSLLFKALSSSEDVIAPAGEHEPWLFLSGNKYPFTSSDQITELHNKGQLLHLLRNDLLIRESEVSGIEFSGLLYNRLSVRGLHTHADLARHVQNIRQAPTVNKQAEQNAAQAIATVITDQRPLTRFDDFEDSDYLFPVENPPYINQPLARRATLDELAAKTVLFKSPSDAYRPGFYESLFPNAQITYVHLTRGLVQTVNGLMDGWSKNEVDFISNPVGLLGEGLNIEGYSNSDAMRAYWCFDLFPGWQTYRDASLVEVCAQQWLQAHRGITRNFPIAGRVTFESFYTHRRTFYEGIELATGVDLRGYDWTEEVMTTEPPSQFRWLKRERLFRNLKNYLTTNTLNEVVEMQEQLGYSMEASTWH